jgi:hypothetical protein
MIYRQQDVLWTTIRLRAGEMLSGVTARIPVAPTVRSALARA